MLGSKLLCSTKAPSRVRQQPAAFPLSQSTSEALGLSQEQGTARYLQISAQI